MDASIWGILGAGLAVVLGLMKYFGRKNKYRIEQMTKANDDLKEAIKNEDKSAFNAAIQRINRLTK